MKRSLLCENMILKCQIQNRYVIGSMPGKAGCSVLQLPMHHCTSNPTKNGAE